ncbi:AAA+-type ATPase [Coniochaeta pulveracea]|uniref:AAA+-type ATPase n=1 Tax=Coniochaeta pulveracea TaxID=177199 RepID=A0A420YDF2_9PEZI|nr:AAA+-type ATPase [Coniochaeta pulveracea]
MKTLEVKIRTTPPGSDQTLKLASKIFISRDALIELTSSVDDTKAVSVVKLDEEGNEVSKPRRAIVCAAQNKLAKVCQMSEALRVACGFSIGDQIRISYSPSTATVPDAEQIVVEAALPNNAEIDADLVGFWEAFLSQHLVHVETLFPGLVLKKLSAKPEDQAAERAGPRSLEIDNVPGREAEVKELNKFLAWFAKPHQYHNQRNFFGMVIHGGHGTGKTMLLDMVAKTGWGTVHRIHFKDKLPEVQETLLQARSQQPSIVLIDGLERLIDSTRSNRVAVILALCETMDALSADAAAKGELPKVVMIATCLDHVTDVPPEMRDPGRFTRDIFLPLPDLDCRKAILESFNLPLPPEERDDILQDLSQRTHAYNAKDLHHLAAEAEFIALCNYLGSQSNQPSTVDQLTETLQDTTISTKNTSSSSSTTHHLLRTHLDAARKKIRPSAMHDVNLKPPPIHWSDIGGQDSVKESLQLAVAISRMPLADVTAIIGQPPKGFLLYGPPGCSKTMAAQAMATESGLNFFAVKGAELLNMYVGESERAVRRLFERAREVSPSMIFFDEIDSIAGLRSGMGSGTATTSHGGLNVLTTLLNEMDGFETMQGVLVLAATNRPQALDPALLRPGRFDELIYVGPPGEDARRAILTNIAAKRRLKDVDVEKLVEMTDGYSGAELVGICRTAGRAAFTRKLKAGTQLGDLCIEMEDFTTAIAKTPKQITPEMLRGYAEWEKKF